MSNKIINQSEEVPIKWHLRYFENELSKIGKLHMLQSSRNEWAEDMRSKGLFKNVATNENWRCRKSRFIKIHWRISNQKSRCHRGVIESNEIYNIVENSESILVDDFGNNLNFYPRYEIIEDNYEHSHVSVIQVQNGSSNSGIFLPFTNIMNPWFQRTSLLCWKNSLTITTVNKDDKENGTATCFDSVFSKVFFWTEKINQQKVKSEKKKKFQLLLLFKKNGLIFMKKRESKKILPFKKKK